MQNVNISIVLFITYCLWNATVNCFKGLNSRLINRYYHNNPTYLSRSNFNSRSKFTNFELHTTEDSDDVEVSATSPEEYKFQPLISDAMIKPPFDKIVDFNLQRNAILYECTLGRDLGLDFIQEGDCVLVDQVVEGSKAASYGVLPGDIVLATSATAGDQMWTHSSVEGIRSSLSTRFVINSTVKFRFERSLASLSIVELKGLKVPYTYLVQLRRPIGLHVVEGVQGGVFVQSIKANSGAASSRLIQVGDEVVSMSASWGGRMWDVRSVESFVVGVSMRSDSNLTLQLRRVIPLQDYIIRRLGKQQRLLKRERDKETSIDTSYVGRMVPTVAVRDDSVFSSSLLKKNENKDIVYEEVIKGSYAMEEENVSNEQLTEKILCAQDLTELKALFGKLKENTLAMKYMQKSYLEETDREKEVIEENQEILTTISMNQLMSAAIRMELPYFAIEIFEDVFGFRYNPKQKSAPYKSYTRAQSNAENSKLHGPYPGVKTSKSLSMEATDLPGWMSDNELMETLTNMPLDINMNKTISGTASMTSSPRALLMANSYVCTTAAKAYGRVGQPLKALALIEWLDGLATSSKPDAFMMTAVLYVLAKAKLVKQAEQLFWKEMPRRRLQYNAATLNSLMFMYAKLNRPDEALKVFELMNKSLGIKSTTITFGILIKALLSANKRSSENKALLLLESLPAQGITPGIEVYNQFYEFYAKTHNYRGLKHVLRVMNKTKLPRVKPNEITYSYLINGFADAKKPRSALAIYHRMIRSGMTPTAYSFMGVLKSLANMRDGLSAVQVLIEMRDRQITPDRHHFSMAMFACVTSGHSALAESLYQQFVRLGEEVDTVLCTLLLRALLQQEKWEESNALIDRMVMSKGIARPNHYTYCYLLQFQMLAGRWEEAVSTLQRTLAMRDIPSTLRNLYSALALSLGVYSSQVKRLQRDSSESSNKRYDRVTIEMDTRQKKLLKRPDRAAMSFLTEAAEEICSYDKFLLEGLFYSELLQGLVLEGYVDLALRIMNLRTNGKVRMTASELSNVLRVEELAKRAARSSVTRNTLIAQTASKGIKKDYQKDIELDNDNMGSSNSYKIRIQKEREVRQSKRG